MKNAIKYDVIYRGAKSLSLKVPNWGIKFIDSLNFIPMALAKFPKTFGQDELCKGYFPHAFNKEENQNYIGTYTLQERLRGEFHETRAERGIHTMARRTSSEQLRI